MTKLEDRKIKLINGEEDKTMRLDFSPYMVQVQGKSIPMGQNIWEAMLANTWFIDETNLTEDIYDWNYKMTLDEITTFKKALAFASNLDGIQTGNLPINVLPLITETWSKFCLIRQSMEEALHCTQYLEMVDTFELDREEIYNMFITDEVMYEKNSHILDVYEKLASSEDTTTEDKILAFFANLALEHIYFYSVFLVFGNFQKLGKMKESAKAIRFIARDEGTTHTELFAGFIRICKDEYPEEYARVLPKAQEMFREAVELEKGWGKYITNGKILGISDATIDLFVESLANEAFAKIGEPALYEGVKNPFLWFYDWLDFNATNERFFEGTVMNYAKGESGANKSTKDSFLSKFNNM